MPSTLIPDDMIERQSVVTEAGMDAVVQLLEAQRSMLQVALDTACLTVEAFAHLTRSVISTALEVSDRSLAASTRSVEQLSRTLTLSVAAEPASGNRPARKPKDTVAA